MTVEQAPLREMVEALFLAVFKTWLDTAVEKTF